MHVDHKPTYVHYNTDRSVVGCNITVSSCFPLPSPQKSSCITDIALATANASCQRLASGNTQLAQRLLHRLSVSVIDKWNVNINAERQIRTDMTVA